MFEVPKRNMAINSSVLLDLAPERERATLDISRIVVGMSNPGHDISGGIRTGGEEGKAGVTTAFSGRPLRV